MHPVHNAEAVSASCSMTVLQASISISHLSFAILVPVIWPIKLPTIFGFPHDSRLRRFLKETA